MQQLSVNGADVSFHLEGSGPAVVLLHSGGSSHKQWRKIVDSLRSDYLLVAPDLWGFGETDSRPGPAALSHDDQADLVAALIDHLKLSSCVLVGHSYGGASAVRLALSRSESIKGMVLIEPIVMPLLKESEDSALYEDYTDMLGAFFAHAERDDIDAAWHGFLDYRNGEGTWDKMPEKSRARFRSDTRSTLEGFHSNLNNPTVLADIKRIQFPVQMLCGEKTTLPDRRLAELIAKTLPACGFTEIPEAGHMSPLSHPDAVADAIRSFAKSLDNASA